MNDTRSIDETIQGRPWRPYREHRLPLMTFVAQAAVGSMFAYFILFVVPLFWSRYEPNLIVLVVCALFLILGLIVGVLPGVIIWACTRSDAEPLNGIVRCAIAATILFPGWAYFALILFNEHPRPDQQLWLLGWILLPAIMIGLLTHSRLRVGRELVRGGEAVRRLSRLLAGLTGFVLRIVVVSLFMESVVTLIYLQKNADLYNELIGAMLLCGHLTASLVVVFMRTDFGFVAALSAIALVPLIIWIVTFPVMFDTFRYVVLAYLGVWAMFLLSRWRQTDVALSFLNEEIHYYLID
ncbi:MAG TPA: hypothetical protein VGW58_10925 [Pyrinomonadaceae bacterium]|nr:hypothetical protein [Pyrinomonadaceae bacterium]